MGRTTVDRMLAEARARIEPRPGPREAAEAMGRGALLVDLRSHDERYRTGVVPGSLHVPRSVLEWRLDPSSGWSSPHIGGFERELILMCAEGYSSSFAAAVARDLGYGRATDLAGGFAAWKDAGLPVQAARPPGDASGPPGLEPPEPPDGPGSVTPPNRA